LPSIKKVQLSARKLGRTNNQILTKQEMIRVGWNQFFSTLTSFQHWRLVPFSSGRFRLPWEPSSSHTLLANSSQLGQCLVFSLTGLVHRNNSGENLALKAKQ
jgi:hypothetical protein